MPLQTCVCVFLFLCKTPCLRQSYICTGRECRVPCTYRYRIQHMTTSATLSVQPNTQDFVESVATYVVRSSPIAEKLRGLAVDTTSSGSQKDLIAYVATLLRDSFSTHATLRDFVEANSIAFRYAPFGPRSLFRAQDHTNLWVDLLVCLEKGLRLSGDTVEDDDDDGSISSPTAAATASVPRRPPVLLNLRHIPITETSLGRVSIKLIVGLACALNKAKHVPKSLDLGLLQTRLVKRSDCMHTATLIMTNWAFVRRAVIYRAGIPLYHRYCLHPDEAPVDVDDCMQYAGGILHFMRGMYTRWETCPDGYTRQLRFCNTLSSAFELSRELFPDVDEKDQLQGVEDLLRAAFDLPIFVQGIREAMDMVHSFCMHQLARASFADEADSDLQACMTLMGSLWDAQLCTPTNLVEDVRQGLRGSCFRQDLKRNVFLS